MMGLQDPTGGGARLQSYPQVVKKPCLWPIPAIEHIALAQEAERVVTGLISWPP